MKRSTTLNKITANNLVDHKQKVAYHEAGHAIAIYYRNTQKELPPVFFKIILKDDNALSLDDLINHQIDPQNNLACIEGGRLLDSLPLWIDDMNPQALDKDKNLAQFSEDYLLAFEADIINLLIGPWQKLNLLLKLMMNLSITSYFRYLL